jgi:hypothetical protein
VNLRNLRNIILIILISLLLNCVCSGQTLNLYGGDGHDIYLGCLNCNRFESSSIWNEYGNYGSPYSSNSIWNEFGTYGSPFSSYSPWNSYSSSAPILVDNNGDFYGYFTINEYVSHRAEFELALTMYKYYAFIRKDISKWYEKIFN